MIWLATLFVFVSSYNEFAFYSLFPFITEKFEGSKEVNIMYFLLLLIAIHNIGRICGFAIWKYCVVSVRKETLMNVCFGLSSLVYTFYGFSKTMGWLVASRFLIGLMCPNYEIMKKYFKEQNRSIDENVYTVVINIVEKVGAITGLLVGSYLYTYKFPNTENYPLLTLSIVSSMMLFFIFIVHFLFASNRIRINCTCNLNPESDDRIRLYSDGSDDEIQITRNETENMGVQNVPHENNTWAFMTTIVYFSSLYNTYRYLMIIYLFWNKYGIISIGNIIAVTEGFGFVFKIILPKVCTCLTDNEKMVFQTAYFILVGVISFFPFIMQVTPFFSNLQIGIIILVNGIIEILYGLVTVLNNGILKKYRLQNVRWSIYSWVTILSNVVSIVFITIITILIVYTKDTEYSFVPFYCISALLVCLMVIFQCLADQITHKIRHHGA